MIEAAIRRIASAFAALSRGEKVAASDRDAALLWLRRLRGFSKTSTDTWLFVADCISGHAELFAKADDRQVLFLVEQKFRAYLKYERSKAAERQKLFRIEELDAEPKGVKVKKVDWKSLKHATLVEQADDVRLTKETDFAQWLLALKRRDDKEAKLYLQLIETTLRENPKCSRRALVLDAELRFQAMKRAPRIKSLTYRRTRAK